VPLAGAAIANSLTNVAGFSVLVSSASFFLPAPSRGTHYSSSFCFSFFSNPLCGKLLLFL
jgi:hypothetical protein